MTNAMSGATRALAAANSQVNMQAIQNTMMQFQAQSERMEMADEYDYHKIKLINRYYNADFLCFLECWMICLMTMNKTKKLTKFYNQYLMTLV
jgi:UDP-N-acetylmuramyl pentapeptide synthase